MAYNRMDVRPNIGVYQWNIDSKRSLRGFFALRNVVIEHLRIHATRTNDPENASIGTCRSKSPPAAPHHAGLHDGVTHLK